MKRGAQHKSLVWLRADLRTADNPALSQASSFAGTPDGVEALFLVCPFEWERHDWGAVRVDFLQRNLRSLARELWTRFRIPLHVRVVARYADVPACVLDVCREQGIDVVWFNGELEWDEAQRDGAVTAALDAAHILCRPLQDQCVVEPGRVLTREARPYAVFTPFKRTWLAYLEAHPLVLEAPVAVQGRVAPDGQRVDALVAAIDAAFAALPQPLRALDAAKGRVLAAQWPEGEAAAQARLGEFLARHGAAYKEDRDVPALEHGTSRLSAYLALGVLSARTCAYEAWQQNGQRWASGSAGLQAWIGELCWRDFYRAILVFFPRVGRGRPFQLATERVAWRYPRVDAAAAADFERWCAGRTGFPIVDAGMRQLQATGWMHNRLRMIVASFLTKDLLIDWRCGEKHFMRSLVDGDFASNNGGWQWSASTGTDAQPYFRVFNPASQSERFDPQGLFIKQWVPELRDVPVAHVHEPGKHVPAERLRKLGYPGPMVDHGRARVLAIESFKRALAK